MLREPPETLWDVYLSKLLIILCIQILLCRVFFGSIKQWWQKMLAEEKESFARSELFLTPKVTSDMFDL